MSRRWTQEEVDFLETHWGTKSLDNLSKCLNRTPIAIETKAYKIGLGGITLATEKVTCNQLATIVNVDRKNIGIWLKNGLPHTKRQLRKRHQYYIAPKDFWKWAKNRKHIDFTRIERGVLIPEPDWLDAKILEQIDNRPKRLTKRWTKTEELTLMNLMKSGKSYTEISQIMQRSYKGVAMKVLKMYQKKHEGA